MPARKIVISINAAWNVVNFRLGLIRGLQEAGHEVIVVAPRDAYGDRLAALGICYLPIEMDKGGISPLRDLQLLWRYWRLLKRIRAEIFLGYTAKPNVYGSLAAQALGMKVINNVSGLGTAFLATGWLRRFVSGLYRVAFRRSSTVFFQNEEDESLFLANGLVTASQARLLPGSGVDLDRFRPAPVDAREEGTRPFVFLLVGRVLRDKGVVEYVEAARRLKREWPRARFQLLGFLNVENRSAIRPEEMEEWVAEGVIEYLGAADDVRPFIAAAECVVLPSYREGLPRTLLEAAAMAKPLIATDVPGCRQVVEDEVNGLLCRARDPESLAQAMRRMLEASAQQRAAWGRAGRERVERDYDERIAVARYLEAIDDAFR